MGQMVESAGGLIVSCKDLPICDSRVESSAGDVSDVNSGHRKTAIARVKEVWRWASATKSPISNRNSRVSVFGKKGGDGAKISFKYEDEGCSPTAVVSSEILSSGGRDQSVAEQKEQEKRLNWITTDSNFLVLEL